MNKKFELKNWIIFGALFGLLIGFLSLFLDKFIILFHNYEGVTNTILNIVGIFGISVPLLFLLIMAILGMFSWTLLAFVYNYFLKILIGKLPTFFKLFVLALVGDLFFFLFSLDYLTGFDSFLNMLILSVIGLLIASTIMLGFSRLIGIKLPFEENGIRKKSLKWIALMILVVVIILFLSIAITYSTRM